MLLRNVEKDEEEGVWDWKKKHNDEEERSCDEWKRFSSQHCPKKLEIENWGK